MSAREESIGLDIISHGEEAYASGEGAILVEPARPPVAERRREPAVAPAAY